MKEVEILVQVFDDKKTVLRKLNRFNFKGIKGTLDVYFYDPKRSNLKPDSKGSLRECFRLRRKDNKNFIAYKVDNFEKGKWIYSDEHETEVLDFKKAEKIIEHLGLKPLVKIDNKKHTFLTKDYEIVFEEVEGAGFFLEVEKIKVSHKENIKKAKRDIWNFIKSLDIKTSKELNIGKPEFILKLRRTI